MCCCVNLCKYRHILIFKNNVLKKILVLYKFKFIKVLRFILSLCDKSHSCFFLKFVFLSYQNETYMKSIVAKALFNSYSYTEYRKLVTDLLSEGKSTGNNQSESLTNYTSLNEARMNRLEKTIKISEDVISKLQNLDNHYIWLVISEGWCGDAAQILPILNKMALASDKRIDLKIVLRDENDELMSQYLTNGGKAIPKVIVICKEAGIVRTDWGPRPKGATDLLANYKKEFGVIDDKIKTDLQLWYLADKGISVQEELTQIMESIKYNRL